MVARCKACAAACRSGVVHLLVMASCIMIVCCRAQDGCRMENVSSALFSAIEINPETSQYSIAHRSTTSGSSSFYIADGFYITEWDYLVNSVTLISTPGNSSSTIDPTIPGADEPTFAAAPPPTTAAPLPSTWRVPSDSVVTYNFGFITGILYSSRHDALIVAAEGSIYVLTLVTSPRRARRIATNVIMTGTARREFSTFMVMSGEYLYFINGSCMVKAEFSTSTSDASFDELETYAGVCGQTATSLPASATITAVGTPLPELYGIGVVREATAASTTGDSQEVLVIWAGSLPVLYSDGVIYPQVEGTFGTSDPYVYQATGNSVVVFDNTGCRVQWLELTFPGPPVSVRAGVAALESEPQFCANTNVYAIDLAPRPGGFNASDFDALFIVEDERFEVARVRNCPASAAFPSSTNSSTTGSEGATSGSGTSETLIVGLAVAGAVLASGIAGAAAYVLRSEKSRAAAAGDDAVASATDDTEMRTVTQLSTQALNSSDGVGHGAYTVATEPTEPGTVPAGDAALATSSLYASSVVDPNHFSVHLMDTIHRPAGPAERASAMKHDLTGTSTPTAVGGEAPVSITQVSALSQSDFRAFADGLGSDKARLLRLRAWSDAEMLRHNRRCEFVAGGQWTRGKVLGRGANGVVYTVVLPDGSAIAMKEVGLVGDPALIAEQLSGIRSELDLLGRLHHDNLVTYYGIVVDPDHLLVRLFMEIVTGGSLASMVMQMEEPLPESAAAMYVRQILRGLAFIHENGVIHRDMKCDNVLRDATTGAVKLADFGTAKAVGNAAGASRAAQTMIGTPYFMAPEILAAGTVEDAEAGYGAKADIWSLGITTAELMNKGSPPWPDFPTPAHAFLHISNPASQPILPDHLSANARDFIETCTNRDPKERPTALELLEHTWFQTILDDSEEEDDEAHTVVAVADEPQSSEALPGSVQL